MSGLIGRLNDLYIRFLVWLGAEPPPGHEHLLGKEAGPKEYILKAGDTLFSVARKFNVHYERLAAANGIETSFALQPGQKLLIPPASWNPSSGPLAQLRVPPSPAPAPEISAPPVEPEAAVPVEEPEPFVEVEPSAEPAAPDLVEEPVSQEVEAVSPPVRLETEAEAEEVAAPAEEVEPTPAPISPPVASSVEVEPAVAAPEAEEIFRYEVQQGDTLNAIARRYGVSVLQLLEANDLTESDRIFLGQKLIIPSYIPQPTPVVGPPSATPPPPVPPDEFFVYTITRGDTLNSIANRYGVTTRNLIEFNQIEHPDHIRVGQQIRIPTSTVPLVAKPEAPVELKPPPLAFTVVDPTFPPQGPAEATRALYVSYFAIGHADTRQRVFDLLDNTELNAVVLDVKGDDGWITYPTQVPLAAEIGADRPMVKDIQVVIEQFKARGVYTIARVVTFKDSLLAKNYPEYAVKLSGSASTEADRELMNWVDPFLQPVWDYNIQLAVEAAGLGFDEIQFSHVRFPTPSPAGDLQFSQEATKETRLAAITGFLSIARGQLQPYRVKVSADVLGYTCWRKDDSLIGQDIERMAQYLDILCPMLYPSTFGSGIPGYKLAIAYPYEVVYESAQRAVNRVRPFNCAVRPWIQDFPDYRFDKRVYGKTEIQAQIKGCFDAGCAGFMVWDHRVKYTDGAYAPMQVQV
jgi:LysM repeat protein